MYESFFKLNARPFLATPVAERYYPAASIEHARGTAARCIERAEGPVVILGSAGMGKSTLCQVLAQQLRERFRVATLASARLCTRRALLQNILFELKQPYRDREEGELRLALIDFLTPSEACPNGMLLLVDEAHMLPLRLLEELRMLTNLVRDGQPRVRLALAAGLVLDERLASPRLESFNQRIAARCYLQSMNHDETCGYVRSQISAVGGDPERVFNAGALQAIFRATGGVPRLVNQVADHVLVMAAAGGRSPVDAAGVEEAWADLQQLPAPWSAGEASEAAMNEEADILEFGELDEPMSPSVGMDSSTEMEAADPGELEPVEPQVATQLKEIESGIAALKQEEGLDEEWTEVAAADNAEVGLSEQYRPPGRAPEIELIFHQAHDPFGESFADEEVIVDPLGSLEALGGAATLNWSSPEVSRPTVPFASNQQQESMKGGGDAWAGVPSAAPQQLGGGSRAEDLLSERSSAVPGDDRDLLEITDDSDETTREYTVTLNPPQRRAYRQLFADLRRR